MTRTILVLTNAQRHVLVHALKVFMEDGMGRERNQPVEHIDRQLAGQYTAAERLAILERAVAMTKEKRHA